MPSPITVTTVADQVARLTWDGTPNIDEVRREVAAALTTHARVEVHVDPDDPAAQRIATWAGLLREGVARGLPQIEGAADRIVFARVSTDAPLDQPEGFRSLLNSFLPRKRAIAQMLVRDDRDRVLLCQLTYKQDWDLPGGVVEVGESPGDAVGREVEEELGLTIAPGDLLLTDWLPPWGGWDDAVCLVFDGGSHDPSIMDRVVMQAREIRDARFCTAEEIRDLAADFTARRIEAALDPSRRYSESGR